MDYYLIPGHGVLAEEFVRRNDFSTAGLRSSDGVLSRLIRTNPALSVRALDPGRVGGPVLLRDYDEFPAASPLSLTSPAPISGYREKRHYRVLFARAPLDPRLCGDEDQGGDRYNWQLHNIGNGVAWCLDVAAHLNDGGTLGPLLDRLTEQMRLRQGLIPVTTERFQ